MGSSQHTVEHHVILQIDVRHLSWKRQRKNDLILYFFTFLERAGCGCVRQEHKKDTLPSNPSPPRHLINVRLLRDAASRLHRNVCYIGYRIALRPRQHFYLL